MKSLIDTNSNAFKRLLAWYRKSSKRTGPYTILPISYLSLKRQEALMNVGEEKKLAELVEKWRVFAEQFESLVTKSAVKLCADDLKATIASMLESDGQGRER